ncbi:ComEA family DNA-binding protein [Sphaerisporangium sp. TRM90804]|uniref:ComEA family DNA-binding protein n=1 Tax=Sphaerisporangium sp. TRM90804 TaxID=3031113 RepID=UPI0024473F11|nr:ComEA family DNA-binding protein [Sphaerisporangium sp. TRM90804]MDH2425115.1 ComEA family DNA-binding protein [Sphaerisporangium sp. TRM90804]
MSSHEGLDGPLREHDRQSTWPERSSDFRVHRLSPGAGAGGERPGEGGEGPRPLLSLRDRVAEALAGQVPLLDPGRPGLRVLLVLGLVAVLVGGFFAWRSRPVSEPLPPPVPVSVPLPPSAAATPSPSVQVIVHVTGKVRKPGLITLPGGARIADAVTAAGGMRAGAKAGGLNLARRLVDGEQIVVGAPAGTVAAPAPVTVPGQATVVDLNAATTAELETLPGVGEVLAGRITEFRQSHGGFTSVDQLREVTGIGDRKYAELRARVRV